LPELKLYDEFTRRDVHDVFAPGAPFTPQAGTWGLQGIVELADRPGDFVLFVTFGREQSGHEFDEGISADGVLRWQSQPSQTLRDRTIGRLIAHDEEANSVHLFLRTAGRIGGQPAPYTYLGRLKYLTHDNQRERPVHFDWQLLDWPMPRAARDRMGLRLEGDGDRDGDRQSPAAVSDPLAPGSSPSPMQLVESDAPHQAPRRGEPTSRFRGRTAPDYAARERANRSLGLAGELLVVEHERATLRLAGRPDLAEKVRHVATEEGDGAGYDVASYWPDGRKRHIEVKTTRGAATSDFFLSPNELAFSHANPGTFELRRLYAFDEKAGTCSFFSLRGDLAAQFELTPTEFKITNLSADDGTPPDAR
jgi:hypothetical protein